jgi:gamma-glutamyl:cysteine ligase YbdK (ATP-grasp superfamily)
MGLEIDRVEFDEADRRLFAERLDRSVEVLGDLLSRPGFGVGAPSLGAELELSLVDAHGRPCACNTEVLDASVDPRLTVELDRFNLEANLRHGPLAGASFSQLESECEDCLREVRRAAAEQGVGVAMVGILPTLVEADLGRESMTECLRYEALSRSLRGLRDEAFLLDIHGDEDLRLACDDVTYEGAATSFQVHLRISPEEFVRVYDAIQMASPVVLALAGNSPLFLHRRLWHETRIALFKQAVDHRPERGTGGRPARVSFGRGWTRSTLDLFSESVVAHPPLLPILDHEDPVAVHASGRLPGLRELRLHQGTVWRWNRAIYDPSEGGHLRVELRSLPSGPTVRDMMANAAFHIGLALELASHGDAWRDEVPFDLVHHDFYRAAREGPEARILWPEVLGGAAEPRAARDGLESLLARAEAGLSSVGVDADCFAPLLEVIDRRAATGQTGAVWQRDALERAEATSNRAEAIRRMFRGYIERSREGEPVHLWRPLEAPTA